MCPLPSDRPAKDDGFLVLAIRFFTVMPENLSPVRSQVANCTVVIPLSERSAHEMSTQPTGVAPRDPC